MLILIPLAILGFLTIFSIVAGSDWSELSSSLGTQNELMTQYSFQIDEVFGAITILIVILSIVVIIGIRIFDSGLSDEAIRTITVIFMYLGIWALMSTFAHPLILQIEVFGALIYVILTIIYVIGIFQKITNEG